MKAKILVTLKQGILDPQGKAIEHALEAPRHVTARLFSWPTPSFTDTTSFPP
jgi:hypothetical protein